MDLGLQAAQFTATSTTAECQTLSNPMYIHSIPNNGDNQDIVSMGTNAALMTKKVIENSFQVLAINYLSLLQVIDFMGFNDKLSETGKDIYNKLRAIVPKIIKDEPLYHHIENIKQYLIQNQPNILK